jgi:VRR-NUC domain-containing protein
MIVPYNLWRLMDPKDQALYSDGQPSEADEQGNFAVECKARGWRPVWHKTHKPSTANRGCPDFIVAAYGKTFWIEFKRPGEELSPDQKAFHKQLVLNGVTPYVVTSAYQAVQIILSECRDDQR